MATQTALVMPSQAKEEIPDSVIAACKDLLGSITLMVNTSGLERKEIAYYLHANHSIDISESHLSEILSGKKNFPLYLIDKLMDVCSSEIPIIWWNHARGYEHPRLRRSQVEIALENEKRKNAALVELLKTAMTGELK